MMLNMREQDASVGHARDGFPDEGNGAAALH